MAFQNGDPVMFCANGRLQCGFIHETQRAGGDGLVDIQTDDGVWYGLDPRWLIPLPRTEEANGTCRGLALQANPAGV